MSQESEAIQRLAIKIKQKKPDALDFAASLTKSFPKSIHLNFMYGSLLRQRGRFDDAKIQLKYTVSIKGPFAEALNELGLAYFNSHEVHEAIRHYEHAIKIKPNFADALNNLGIAYQERNFSQRDLQKALQAFRSSLKIMPNNSRILHNIGSCYREEKQYDQALTVYKQALEVGGESPALLQSLGITYSKIGDIEQAKQLLLKALVIGPNLVEAKYVLASIAYDEQDWDSCLMYLKELSEHRSSIDEEWRWPYKLLKMRMEQTGSYQALRSHSSSNRFPMILNHEVDDDLVGFFLNLKLRPYDQTSDTRYGAGDCSIDFKFLETPDPKIQKLSEGLLTLVEAKLSVCIVACESFLNISRGESGTGIHSHLNLQDADFDQGLDKYSFVYYVDVGDQTGTLPGVLRLHEPEDEILPSTGDLVIIPASRKHSAVYNGEAPRILIGANFYAVNKSSLLCGEHKIS